MRAAGDIILLQAGEKERAGKELYGLVQSRTSASHVFGGCLVCLVRPRGYLHPPVRPNWMRRIDRLDARLTRMETILTENIIGFPREGDSSGRLP